MREAIRRILIDNIAAVRVGAPGLAATYNDSRVYELHAVTKDTPRPWIVLQVAAPDPAEPWSEMAQTINVWPNVSQESYQDLDVLIAEIESVLDGRRFSIVQGADTRQFYVEQRPGGEDAIEDEWGGITKLLRFVVYELGWLSFETFDPDPIKALREWAAAKWPGLQHDPATWNPTNDAPGLYWRLVGIPREIARYPTHTMLEARIMGHVLAPDYRKRLEWTRRVTEELMRTRRIMISEPDPDVVGQTITSPMFLEGIGADSQASPFTTGQITILGQYGLLLAQPAAPTVAHVHVSGDVQRQEVR